MKLADTGGRGPSIYPIETNDNMGVWTRKSYALHGRTPKKDFFSDRKEKGAGKQW